MTPARMLTPDEFYDAADEGKALHRRFQTGARGMQCRAEDSPDYCVALAVQRKFCKVNRLQETEQCLAQLEALLPDICQLLDTAREDFMHRGLWTEWDQSVRDRITAYNLENLRRRRPVVFSVGPHHDPCQDCVKAGRCALANGG